MTNLNNILKKYNNSIKDDKYFTIDKINKLNLPYDILIITSARSTGKSYQIYELIKSLKPNEYFVLVRTLKEELKQLSNHFATDTNSIIDIIGDKIYLKEYDADGNLLPQTQRRLVGRTASMRNAANYKSSFGDGFKFMVYDEFIDDQGRKIADVNLIDFISLMVSIKRKTPDFKCYMFSNLIGDRTILLNQMNIDKNKEIEYKTASTTYEKDGIKQKITNNILYLNLMNKFESINNDTTLALMTQLNEKIANAWKNNSSIKSSDRIISGDITKPFKPIMAYTDGHLIWFIKFYKKLSGINQEDVIYYIEDTIFTNSNNDIPTFTASYNILNLYDVQYLSKSKLKKFIKFIENSAKHKKLFLSSSQTLSLLLDDLYKKL